MTETMKESVFKEVLLHSETNNFMHRTNEMSKKELIVRRGQPFTLTLTLAQPLRLGQSVVFTAATGSDASEKSGTLSIFGINVKPSLLAKAVWKMELDKTSDLQKGNLSMIITPPADSPIGKYTLSIKHKDGDTAFATVVVLFNPWCSDDTVFLSSEKKLKEYVLNEEGKVYYGSADYISSMDWNFGQFGDKMVEICLKLLDYSTKHNEDPAADVASRSDPLYVGRVVSAMINVQDDYGVLVGNWSGSYEGGSSPTHWTSSHNILMEWYNSEYRPVRYGQCWVFASVMCSVMRMLGVPTRVVTNFCSAHDTNSNLTIDKFHDEDGAELNMGGDSVWNFHVWVESWMKRPDLGSMFDGWQVLDPTPQETSDGIYCCGPASVKAIWKGETATNYDVPFVFAEVNADCVDWQFQADGSKVKLKSDSKRVGRNISTKAVGINKRIDITLKYKHKEGSKKERSVFIHAITRDYTKDDEDEDEVVDSEEEEEEEIVESEGEEDTEEIEWPPMSIEFEEMTQPMIGKDVSLRLVVRSKTTADTQLIIKISVQAMRYNGTSAAKIQTSMKEETLQPGKDLHIPIVVPYDVYHKPMLSCESLKISAVIQDKYNKENLYLAEDDVLLLDPPLIITVCGDYARVNRLSSGKLVFTNNLSDVLKNCSLTLSGNGLWKGDVECKIPDLKPSTRITAMFSFCPYKPGKKTLVGVFDCNELKDVKGRCKVNVLP